ncbi:MAG: PQQ-binding-like beta-propeller repeat protein [Mariprofundaceae bacterium]
MISTCMKLAGMGVALLLASCAGLPDFSDFSSEGGGKEHAAVATAESNEMPGHRVRGGVSVAWQTNVDQRAPASPSGFSLPFAFERDGRSLIVAGARDRRARIYNQSGQELLRIALEHPSESGALLLENGLVVVGDVQGVLYGLDPIKGTVVWSRQLSSLILGKPVALQDGFVVQTADNRIYSFSAAGKKRWSYTGKLGGIAMHMGASPLFVDGQIYAVFTNGDVVALKAESGALLWRRQLILKAGAAVLSELRVPVADPVLVKHSQDAQDGDALLIAFYQGDLVMLSRLDGSRIFNRKISLKTSPLTVGQTVYVAGSDGAVQALDVQSGQTLWKQKLSEGELVGPVLWRDNLWIADDQGVVFRLDTQGNTLGSRKLSGRIERSPVPMPAGVLVRNDLGTLYLLR